MEKVIHIEDLTVSYGENPVLWDLDLDIEKGTLTAVVGPNGAGKSTLIKVIVGLLKPLAGTIQISAPYSNNLGYIPQRQSINWDFPINVLDVVLMGLYRKMGWCRWIGKKQKKLALQALEMVNMHEMHKNQISDLSGGAAAKSFFSKSFSAGATNFFNG